VDNGTSVKFDHADSIYVSPNASVTSFAGGFDGLDRTEFRYYGVDQLFCIDRCDDLADGELETPRGAGRARAGAAMKSPRSPDTRITQTLASGIIVRQDFRTATRFAFFVTGTEEWPYATHGGTLFVVLYRGRPYGLTCRHVFGTFNWGQLVITAEQYGGGAVRLSQIAYPSEPRADAIDTDVLDVAVVLFADDVDATFFKGSAYLLDEKTVTTSRPGDALRVHGTLKTHSEITETEIAPKFCLLELVDDTPFSHDPTLRRGFGVFDQPEFADVVGLSGSPVFNVTQSALCGMVVRGTLRDNMCTLWYVDIFDVCKLLEAVHAGHATTDYQKVQTVAIEVPQPGK
jgi:hypothetical protein